MSLILASESARRRELLLLLTKRFTTTTAKIDEAAFVASSPQKLAETLAIEKANAVFLDTENAAVLACDTVVDLNGTALGKPKSEDEAVEMLCALSARWHKVHTGVCLMQSGKQVHTFVETTRVLFAAIPMSEVLAIAATGEPYDKAGGYGIQGWAARFIPRIEGCYYNVMGLPLAALQTLLAKEGLL